MDPQYLGDGVYIKQGSWEGELIMYTDDNIIYLDEEVITNLYDYLKSHLNILDREG